MYEKSEIEKAYERELELGNKELFYYDCFGVYYFYDRKQNVVIELKTDYFMDVDRREFCYDILLNLYTVYKKSEIVPRSPLRVKKFKIDSHSIICEKDMVRIIEVVTPIRRDYKIEKILQKG